jgi:hypothetical protein
MRHRGAEESTIEEVIYVFVLSVLEGLSDEDCQSLLRCTRQELAMARNAGLRHFVEADHGHNRSRGAISVWPSLLN